MNNIGTADKPFSSEHPRVIIACRVMKPELEALRGDDSGIEIRYLDANLHETPTRMPQLIQSEIDDVISYASQIIIGYGLCSNGIVGLRAPRQGLIIPRIHDCIALFLGSREIYNNTFTEKPGTYYLTPGWIEERKDPVGYMEKSYVPKMGRKMAEWGLKEELKNYTHISLINTESTDMEPLRKIAMENAAFLSKEYEEIKGLPDFFKKLVSGPYPDEDFIHLQPDDTMKQAMIVG